MWYLEAAPTARKTAELDSARKFWVRRMLESDAGCLDATALMGELPNLQDALVLVELGDSTARVVGMALCGAGHVESTPEESRLPVRVCWLAPGLSPHAGGVLARSAIACAAPGNRSLVVARPLQSLKGNICDPALVGARVAAVLDELAGEYLHPLPSDHPQGGFMALGFTSHQLVQAAHRLSRELQRPVAGTALFDHSSLDSLVAHLARHRDALRTVGAHASPVRAVSIGGASCALPGAVESPAQLFANLARAAEAICITPRWDVDEWCVDAVQSGKASTRHGGLLTAVGEFDAPHFGISPGEAKTMSPSQCLLLQHTERALGAAEAAGLPVAVCVGSCHHDCERLQRSAEVGTPYMTTGTATSVLAGCAAV